MTITVTKSIRLSSEESQEISQMSEKFATSEASLMKKWVLNGIRTEKLEEAIQAYSQRKTDLRGGALMAGVSYNQFLHEIQARNIIVLENDHFLDELAFLAQAFNNKVLQKAVQQVREQGDLLPIG